MRCCHCGEMNYPRSSNGYLMEHAPDHPNADAHGYVLQHRLVAERALGKVLRRSAKVHHVDNDRDNNAHCNLVICESQAYHNLLHARARIQRHGGDPNADKICGTCQEVKSKIEFNRNRTKPDGFGTRCRECWRNTNLNRRRLAHAEGQIKEYLL